MTEFYLEGSAENTKNILRGDTKPPKGWWFCELELEPQFRWVYTNQHGRFYIYPKRRPEITLKSAFFNPFL